MRWPFSSESWWLQLPQILDQVAAHFFLKTDAFSGWTNRETNIICDALHSDLPPDVKRQDFPPAHQPWWRPGSHDTKAPYILKFYHWKLCALLSRPPISILLALCSTIPFSVCISTHTSLIQIHSLISATNFCRVKICNCNPDWTQFNQHMPLTQTFSGTLCSGAVTHHKDRGQFWLLFVFPHLQFW